MEQFIAYFSSPSGSQTLIKMIAPCLMSILFLQSGIDKALNYKGNLAYFNDYFKNSILAKFPFLLLPIITIMEIISGILCLIGTYELFAYGDRRWAYWGLIGAASSLIALFFGQRMAKDYAGSVNLVVYIIACMLGLLQLV